MQSNYAVPLARGMLCIFKWRCGEIACIQLAQFVSLIKQVVDHDMADMKYSTIRFAFVFQMLLTTGFGDKKPVGNAVGDQPVDFFWHLHIAAA